MPLLHRVHGGGVRDPTEQAGDQEGPVPTARPPGRRRPSGSGSFPSCILKDTTFRSGRRGPCVGVLHISSLRSPQSSTPLQVWFLETHFLLTHLKPQSEDKHGGSSHRPLQADGGIPFTYCGRFASFLQATLAAAMFQSLGQTSSSSPSPASGRKSVTTPEAASTLLLNLGRRSAVTRSR
ncbi:hypothetical protein EYF80_057508 [Liparis tanakae]|uniref:Uncharacterized protein n=1 Tax=Liparis tanakae TaxID=230148 RepID=A0A4Z2EU72_9TELE|nr:hypothetical protein EYF80_057508 [Liparis tanakae]